MPAPAPATPGIQRIETDIEGNLQSDHDVTDRSLWKGLLPRLVLKSVGSSIWYAVYMAARGLFPKGMATV